MTVTNAKSTHSLPMGDRLLQPYLVEDFTNFATMPAPRILIVEDEPITAEDLAVQVRNLGMNVIGPANNFANAIVLLTKCEAENEIPDLVLLDLGLEQRLDGVALARVIERRWHIPIIIVSANLSHPDLGSLAGLPIYGYVVKPFHPLNLREVILKGLSDSINNNAWVEKTFADFFHLKS